MQFFMIIASSLLFVHSVLGQTRAPDQRSLYKHVRQCKTNLEKCSTGRCGGSGSLTGSFPFSSAYACCAGNVIDENRHVCTGSGVLDCNPCTQFRCGDGRCTLGSWKCDRFKDCLDGLDEVGCGSCKSDEFQCKNQKCISKDGICNKVNDCDDGSDEFKCVSPRGSCGTERYRCGNNQCISGKLFCDGKNDCGDNSDEQGPGCKRNVVQVSRPRDTIPEDEEAIEEDYNDMEPPKDADTDVITG